MNESLNLYLASWFWHIQAIIFLAFALLFMALNAVVFWIPMIALFAVCEVIAYQRKRSLDGINNN